MGLFVNSFEIELPTIEADLYSIDPQPSGDKYSVLNSHTEDLEDTVGGKGRWYRRGDEYFIATIGPDGSVQTDKNTIRSTPPGLNYHSRRQRNWIRRQKRDSG